MPILIKFLNYIYKVRTNKQTNEKTYTVRVMHRDTKDVVWTGSVKASSSKGAQRQWRKEYSHIRAQYDYSYCLGISRNI